MSTIFNTNPNNERYIGQILSSPELPTLLIIGGIHGNEKTGVRAIEEVFNIIENQKINLNGNFIGIRGNLKALNNDERYIDQDLNRMWTDKKLSEITSNSNFISEAQEVYEIKSILDGIIDTAQAPVTFVDLHTTSSQSSPFVIIEDTIRNRQLSKALPNTKVLGILEKLHGTILGYYGDKGPQTLVFEAGEHREERSFHCHVAAIFLLLIQTGLLSQNQVNQKSYFEYLKKASYGFPEFVETNYRLALSQTDQFKMKPGYKNFTQVSKGDEVAELNGEPVIIDEDAYIFMPLYQEKGEDGFFLVKPIKPFWIKMSQFLRTGGYDKLLAYLPGVKKNPAQPHSYMIKKSIAFYKTLDIFHLFGYRYERQQDDNLIVERMPYDLKGPWDN